MICIECGRPVNDVYKEFGKAGSGNIRLTRCVCIFTHAYTHFLPVNY